MSMNATRPSGANDTGLLKKAELLFGATPVASVAPSGSPDDPVIVGAENIAVVIYGEVEGRREGNIRRIYHAISKKELPTFRLGGRVHARRSTILAWIERQESAA